MSKRAFIRLGIRLGLIMVFLLALPTFAETSQETTILLRPVQIDTPFFKRLDANEQGVSYPIKMIKVRETSQIVTPPVTTANILYYSEIKLGLPPVKYGLLMDLEGKDKLLWVDSNADGKYADENPYPLYKSDRYPRINVYYSPLPLRFNVKYTQAAYAFQTTLEFDLPYLILAQSGFNDFFSLKTRTWLTGVINGGKDELRIALVDSNDNGIYNDPEDLIFLDTDYDLYFTVNESRPLKLLKSIRFNSKENYRIEYLYTPEKLILKKE